MKIVIIGGSGLIGNKLGVLLRESGHNVVPASPSTGVNTLTGKGLDEVLAGTDVVVDVTNSPSFADNDVMSFFTQSTTNQLAAEKRSGVGHHVALTIVGADCIPDSGYMRAKVAQEELIQQSEIPYTIVRATQFFEFLGGIAGADPDFVRLSTAPFQPIAADDVASFLALATVTPPRQAMMEIAGPEESTLADFVGRFLAASHDPRKVVADPHARYFGAVLDELGLSPRGANPKIGPTKFEDWLGYSSALNA
ncbi:SDR family oxidoreductase [Bremerella alba]|uniref:NAD(P)-binding domain-containing protein n=1 Tax=Bremerella alba TaxID=980252 RepID=A0A7V8VAC4_9BACT|nr:SDR family oxidoreductase [Bremerella alba]MBA2117850.1 hypothetical protein [Bremerella alba]